MYIEYTYILIRLCCKKQCSGSGAFFYWWDPTFQNVRIRQHVFCKKKIKFPNFVNENRLTYFVWSKITTTVFCENCLSGSWNTGHGNNISYYCIKYTVLYCNTLKFQNQFSLFYMCSSSTVQHYNSSSMGLSSDILPNIEHYSLDKNVFFSSQFTKYNIPPCCTSRMKTTYPIPLYT